MKIKACVFDAFGTLFKTDISIDLLNQETEGKGAALLNVWRQKQLEYTWLRTIMHQYKPLNEITRDALTFAKESLDIQNPKIYDILMPVFEQAICFPNAPTTLAQLKAMNITCAVLSNGTLPMLEAGIANAKVDHLIDHIFSVERIKVYKPDEKVYQMAMSGLNLFEDEMLFLSGNQWDIAGASTFGLQTVWINRNNDALEQIPNAKYTISSLSELPDFINSL